MQKLALLIWKGAVKTTKRI